MENIATKVNGGSVSASEFNQPITEIENAISSTGISFSSGDLNQLAKSIINMIGNGTYYADTGAANAYVCALVGSLQSPSVYTIGMLVRFRPANANSGASTINVASLGIKNIKQKDGSTDLTTGMITITDDTWLIYDGTSFRLFSLGNLQVSNLIATDITVDNIEATMNITSPTFTGTHLGTFQRIIPTMELSAAATEIDITGLDGNTDVDYKMIMIVKTATTGGLYELLLRFNDDTGANYVRQYFSCRSIAVAAERTTSQTSAYLSYDVGNVANGYAYLNIDISAKSGFFRSIRVSSQEKSSVSVLDLKELASSWENSADNITSIKLLSSLANGFGIGTRVELYARR